MKKASFSLYSYYFSNIKFKLENNHDSENLRISFAPTGEFTEKDSVFNLKFTFKARQENEATPFIVIECIALFKFSGNIIFEEIPDYFYVNSIAILFPYIRAFISTITLQANVSPLVLPTMNLVGLADQLRKKSKAI